MALETSKVKLPLSVVTTLINKAKDTSTIAALSTAQPVKFSDQNHLIFTPSSEAEVVAEGAKKGSYEQKLSIVDVVLDRFGYWDFSYNLSCLDSRRKRRSSYGHQG